MWDQEESTVQGSADTLTRPMPRISVLMTVYNGSASIEEAISSLVNQDFNGPYEIIIVNDGSTDSTPELLRAIEWKYPNVHVFDTGRIGRARALNFGLSQCRAPYVAINDCDDISYPERLRLQVEYLDDNPDVALVAGWARVIDDEGNEIEARRVTDNKKSLRRRLAIGNPFIHSTVTYRRERLERLGGFRESQVVAIDYDVIERIARHGELGFVEEFLLTHYRGERQYFRANTDVSIRWRSAGKIAMRAALRHSWWMLPVSTVVYILTLIPGVGILQGAVRRIHGQLVSGK